MSAKPRRQDEPVNEPRDPADTVQVTVDINRMTDPELFAAVTAVRPGKPRGRRVRSLMLVGYMVGVLGNRSPPPHLGPVSSVAGSGAADVFEPPVEE